MGLDDPEHGALMIKLNLAPKTEQKDKNLQNVFAFKRNFTNHLSVLVFSVSKEISSRQKNTATWPGQKLGPKEKHLNFTFDRPSRKVSPMIEILKHVS